MLFISKKKLEKMLSDRVEKEIEPIIDNKIAKVFDYLLNPDSVNRNIPFWGTWLDRYKNSSPRKMIETVALNAVKDYAEKEVLNKICGEINGEAFIDGIIERVNRKQLGGRASQGGAS